ncbi:hypothetical protein [Nocardia terpenica]|uniref:Uncharacterized protein n=1 Tax=Nocardia terpenica TaxID=455432 RepID=A0A164K5R3_9NOCA|nr:hypothetical protein [Nocardia terpenica]KZM71063.1 hypothetical protein AWN90_41850 [Nocardia terpenica]NQE89616.1 hypothetical protein [Nocardia terpenica]
MAAPKNTFEYYGTRSPNGWTNPAIAALLVGPKMRATVQRVGVKAVGLWQARAPRKSGELANSAAISMRLMDSGDGPLGAASPRWVADVEAKAGYSAAVNFGRRNWRGMAARDTPRNLTKRGTVRQRRPGKTKASRTWQEIIRIMGAS